MNTNFAFPTIFTFSLILFSQSSLAGVCGSESPNLKTQGDKYFEIDEARSLSRSGKKTVSKMFKLLKGRWQGNKTYVECIGAEGEQKKETSQETVDAEMLLDSGGQLTITLDIFNPKKSVTYNDTLTYFSDNIPSMVEKLATNGFTSVSKRRRGPGARHGSSILMEEITEIKVNKKSVSVNIITYLNGYFSDKTSIKLRR